MQTVFDVVENTDLSAISSVWMHSFYGLWYQSHKTGCAVVFHLEVDESSKAFYSVWNALVRPTGEFANGYYGFADVETGIEWWLKLSEFSMNAWKERDEKGSVTHHFMFEGRVEATR